MSESIKKFWRLLTSKEKSSLSMLILFMIINAVVEIFSVASIPVYVALVGGDVENSRIRIIYQWLNINDLSLKDVLLYGGIAVALIYLVKTAVGILSGYLQERFVRGREFRISTDLFTQYITSPIIFHFERNPAELTRNAQIETQQFCQGFLVPLLKGTSQLLILPFLVGILLIANFKVSALAFIIIITAVFSYDLLIRKRLHRYGKILQENRAKLLNELKQGFEGIKEIKVTGSERYFTKRFKSIANRIRRITIITKLANRVNTHYLELVSVLSMLLIVALLGILGFQTNEIAPIIALFAVSMLRIKQGTTVVMNSISSLRVNHITINPIYNDLMLDHQYATRESRRIADTTSNVVVRFDKVSYSYPGTNKQVLKDITFEISEGESIGIVGTTGSGKSTLVDLTLGLLSPQIGIIQCSVDRTSIGYVPQKIYLLGDTVRNNVAFGIDSSQINDDSVWKCLKVAQLNEFIESLPNKLDTVIGDSGVPISGGQGQRIGIARSIYRNPQLLILDEATSSLDNSTERKFMDSLSLRSTNRTMIIIAHRLNTVKDCDRIFMIEKGRIVGDGNYEELIKNSSSFRKLAV